MAKVLKAIESDMADGTFDYARYFPNSKALEKFAARESSAFDATPELMPELASESAPAPSTPLLKDFAQTWLDERSIEWRRSHIRSLVSTINGRILPAFGNKAVGDITKADILAFRASLAKVETRGGQKPLSPKRINEIVGALRQILEEAADRFEFTSPADKIKRLRVNKTDVHPFSLDEVRTIIATVRPDYRDYFTVRFFTGMRTGEAHGLKWKYVDFERRLILIRETFVLGEDEYTKTDGSQREIQMSQPVYEALLRQWQITGEHSVYVFCNQAGQPLDNKNFSDRVWYPLLRYLDLERRRPYQMRHTAATLWLASGEAPEWIARQLGHTSTEMLFRVYSRYVPNLTRQDGSAFDRLLATRMATTNLVNTGQVEAGAHVYVLGESKPPMPQPKRRGVGKPGLRDKDPPPALAAA
jgi:integrase